MLGCWHSFYLFCWLRLFRQKLVKYSRQNMVAISRRQHFSRKALLFAPKGGTILLLVPTRFSERMCRESAWCGQNRRDETACFDPGGAQTAFGTQNSKCDRALTAPPEFKSLMLRQKAVLSVMTGRPFSFPGERGWAPVENPTRGLEMVQGPCYDG